MDCEEELDLDALADLLDEEELTPQDCKAAENSSNVISNSQVNSEKDTKIRKYVPIDIFAVESNTRNNEMEASKKVDKCKDSVHSQNADSSDEEEDTKTYLTETGKMIKKNITLKPSYDARPQHRTIKTWKDNVLKPTFGTNKSSSTVKTDSHTTDEFSGIRIINPVVPHDVLKSRMNGRRMIKMSSIKHYMRNGDIKDDWVTIGVLVNKVPPRTSKNGKTYSIWKMSDLQDIEKIVSIFLFGAVHVEHWKTSVGTVIGILNPSFFSNNESKRSDEITLSVDQPGKFMMIGTSKDFGHCKGVRRDGTSCSNIVNKSLCEFCTYHVSKEYKKLSSKRVELQASYSGRQPSLKNKLLKGNNIMYGGQLFVTPNQKPKPNSRASKDTLTLNSLCLKRKAEELERAEAVESVNNLSEVHGMETNKEISSESKFINNRLSIPSAGSKNLFRHLVKAENATVVKQQIISVTPKELLKMHEKEMRAKRARIESPSLPSNSVAAPQLGRGCRPGGEICFSLDSLGSAPKRNNSAELNKLRAIRKIQQKGPLKQQNPNAVKGEKTPKTTAKIKLSVEKYTTENGDKPDCESTKSTVISTSLGCIDLSSEKVQNILNRKSSHSYEVEIEEMEKQERYFSALEKKEQMEEKMLSTFEIVCDVVSCLACRYTAHHATDMCKGEDHPLKRHKAVKRFFKCVNCTHRTYAFTRLPKRRCRNCGEKNFERTSMMKPRTGPKLASEILLIRGEEVKNLNTLK